MKAKITRRRGAPKAADKAQQPAGARQWRNRIAGHGEVDAKELAANPKNWRIHPKAQQDALQGVLKKVGWVQDVVVNQRSGFVVDGHARVSLAAAAGEQVPVVYVDLSEEEEALILATLDPLSAMAVTDEELFGALAKDLVCDDSALEALIRQTSGDSGEEKSGPAGSEGDSTPSGQAPIIQYNIIFNSVDEQKAWFEFLKALRGLYPDLTIAERIVKYVGERAPAAAAA